MIPLPFSRTRFLICPPTQSHTSAIEASLTRKEGEMTQLDIRITKLKNRLAFLTNERQLLQEALSPINKLSPELLQEIFVFCLPVAHNAVMSAREAPLLLCRVCHRWRQLALATPRLWASIHIPLCHNMASVPVPSPDDVNSWLSRSKSLPLSISLHCYSPSYYTGLEQIKYYLDGIISGKNRWKSLHVSNPASYILEYVFSDHAVFDSLEELHIAEASLPIMDEKKSLPPQLHSLSLPFDALMLFRVNANYTRLTRLGITCPKYGKILGSYELSDIVEVLLSVPRLQNLSISGFHTSFPIESSPLSHPTIPLPNLEVLSITNYQPYSHVRTLLRALHTPLLRHWKYYFLASHSDSLVNEHLDVLRIFLRRLREPLEELDLHLHSCGTEFRRILSLLPGLKRLSLRKPLSSGPWSSRNRRINDIGDSHLGCLTEESHFDWKNDPHHSTTFTNDITKPLPDTTSNIYCPQLEVIQCACARRSLSENVLLDFLRLRTGSGAKAADITPLKKVVILIESPISDGLREKEKVHQLLDGTGTLFHLISAPPYGRFRRI